MPKYLIGVSCARAYDPIPHENCRNRVEDCRQIYHLLIEADGPLTADEIDQLNEKYKIPDCTQTGCGRFLGSSVITNSLNTFEGYKFLTIDDLVLKK